MLGLPHAFLGHTFFLWFWAYIFNLFVFIFVVLSLSSYIFRHNYVLSLFLFHSRFLVFFFFNCSAMLTQLQSWSLVHFLQYYYVTLSLFQHIWLTLILSSFSHQTVIFSNVNLSWASNKFYFSVYFISSMLFHSASLL